MGDIHKAEIYQITPELMEKMKQWRTAEPAFLEAESPAQFIDEVTKKIQKAREEGLWADIARALNAFASETEGCQGLAWTPDEVKIEVTKLYQQREALESIVAASRCTGMISHASIVNAIAACGAGAIDKKWPFLEDDYITTPGLTEDYL